MTPCLTAEIISSAGRCGRDVVPCFWQRPGPLRLASDKGFGTTELDLSWSRIPSWLLVDPEPLRHCPSGRRRVVAGMTTRGPPVRWSVALGDCLQILSVNRSRDSCLAIASWARSVELGTFALLRKRHAQPCLATRGGAGDVTKVALGSSLWSQRRQAGGNITAL